MYISRNIVNSITCGNKKCLYHRKIGPRRLHCEEQGKPNQIACLKKIVGV